MSIRVAGGVVSGKDQPAQQPDGDVPLNEERFQNGVGTWATPGDEDPETPWSFTTGATPTATTGPAGGSDAASRAIDAGNGYAFTEASESVNNAGPWSLESPILNAFAGAVTLTFDVHMNFNNGAIDDGVLKVQGWDGSAWSDIGNPITGSQQASATANWRPSTDFGTYDSDAFSNGDFYFRFLFTRGTNARAFDYDCAIDNVVITGGSDNVVDATDLDFDTGVRRLHVTKDGADPLDGQVPDQKFTTIQAAINSAQPGDVISIADGRYFEALSLTDFEGTAAFPLWIVAENRGEVIVSNLLEAAFNGTLVWTNEGSDIYSVALASRPYVMWEDEEFLPPYLLGDLQASTFQATASASFGLTTFNKVDRGFAHVDGRVHVKLGDASNPNGQSISLPATASQSGFTGTRSRYVILDGIVFEGAGGGPAVRFDELSTQPTVRNCRFVGCRVGVLVGADNMLIDQCEFRQVPGFLSWSQAMRSANSADSNVVERYVLDYYFSDARFGSSNTRGNALLEGGIDATTFNGRPALGLVINQCFMRDCYDGCRIGFHATAVLRESIIVGAQGDGADCASFTSTLTDDVAVHDCQFLNCQLPIRHGSASLQKRHLAYRNLVLNLDTSVARPPFLIGATGADQGVELHYYQNTFINRALASDEYTGFAGAHTVWTGRADRILTFQNNIVIFPNDLDSAAVNPVTAAVNSNAVASPADNATAQQIHGGNGGVYTGATEASMGLLDNFTPDDGTRDGSLGVSPSIGIGTALAVGLPDSRSGFGVNDNAGVFNDFIENEGDNFPRLADIVFQEQAPARWPKPGRGATPPTPPPVTPPAGSGGDVTDKLGAVSPFQRKNGGAPFTIFHDVRFGGSPETPESLGMREMDVVYQSAWLPGLSGSQGGTNFDGSPPGLAEQRVGEAGDIFMPDVETWWPTPGNGTTPVSSAGINAFETLGARINAVKGDKIWGWYSTIPQRSYFAPVRGGSLFNTWQNSTNLLADMADQVDFTAPSLYTFSTLRDQDDWVAYAIGNISEARRISGNKPCIPVLWPFFHSAGTEPIPTQFMLLQMQTVFDAGCEGVLMWETSQNRRLSFSQQGQMVNAINEFVDRNLDDKP